MRDELLVETVDRVVQSKEDGKLCLGCLGVDLQGSCSQSLLCLPGSLGSQSFLCLPGSLGSLPLVPESAGQIEEAAKRMRPRVTMSTTKCPFMLEGTARSGSD